MSAKTRIERLVSLVAAMKNRDYPNARRFAEFAPATLRVSPKTIQRDIRYLREHLHAPVDYDEKKHGYYLRDPSWAFPFDELQGHAIWALMLCGQVSRHFLPPHLQSEAGEALRAQLAVAELEDLPVDALRAIVCATGAQAPPQPGLFDLVCQACRECRRLHITYRGAVGKPRERDVDVHALFLADGAWYARVHCRLRQAHRSLALHRILAGDLLDITFSRSESLVDAVRHGHVFDQEILHDIRIRGSKAKARILTERQWFPGQQTAQLADGSVELSYAEGPADDLLWWVLSYAGHLEVIAPEELRRRVQQAAQTIAARHQPDSLIVADGNPRKERHT